MSGNSFIDTNVLVYFYTEDEPLKKQKALAIVNASNAVISTQVLTELANTLKKKFKLDWQTVEDVISELHAEFEIYANEPETIKSACQIAEKYRYSFYDSLIISAALSCNCQTLYSEDMQDGQVIDNTLVIRNPFRLTDGM